MTLERAIPADSQLLAEAARLMATTNHDRAYAKRYLLTWLLITAAYEDTTPSAVLDKLVRSQPPWRDQRGLVQRLRGLAAGNPGTEAIL